MPNRSRKIPSQPASLAPRGKVAPPPEHFEHFEQSSRTRAGRKAPSKAKLASAATPKRRPARKGPFMQAGERILDTQDVLGALRGADGIRSIAAKALNVARNTLSSYLDLHPELLEALAEIHEANGDLVESKLFKAIRDDDLRAVTFYLSTRMKHRGYTTRVESTGAGGGPIQHEITPSPDAMLELLEKMAAVKAKAVQPDAPNARAAPVGVAPIVPVVDRKPNGRGPAIA